MSKYQEIAFSINDYQDKAEMFNVVNQQLQILLDAGYLAVVRYDAGPDVVVIEFEHNENRDPWGCYYPMWVNENEGFLLDNLRRNNEEKI